MSCLLKVQKKEVPEEFLTRPCKTLVLLMKALSLIVKSIKNTMIRIIVFSEKSMLTILKCLKLRCMLYKNIVCYPLMDRVPPGKQRSESFYLRFWNAPAFIWMTIFYRRIKEQRSDWKSLVEISTMNGFIRKSTMPGIKTNRFICDRMTVHHKHFEEKL